MGESTTGSGRVILEHQCRQVNRILMGEYDLNGDAVIYGDTDSTYFKTFAKDKDEAIEIADTVANIINTGFQPFMKKIFMCQPGYDNIIKCGREIVSDRGIFVDKKKYILHVVDNEGVPVNKLKVMGLDTIRTTLPKVISKEINKFIERVLQGEDWNTIADDIVEYKEILNNNKDVRVIGLPKGIKNLEKYTNEYKDNNNCNLPGHVAASICYNLCLDKFNDKVSIRITSGMKIKVFYLKHILFEKFKSIALPTDIEIIPEWFYDTCKIDNEQQLERLVDNPLRNIIKAIDREPPSKQERMFQSIMVNSVSFEPQKKKRIVKNKDKMEQNKLIDSLIGI
jgi:DNA polymerase elongation subunit (family B)